MRLGELPEEPGLAGAGAFEGLPKLVQFAVAPDEARQASCGRGMQSRTHRGRAHQLVDFDGLRESLYRDWAEGPDLDVSLRQPQGPCGKPGATRRRQLFHPTRQMRRLADCGVVHVEIASNCADDDLARVQANPDPNFDPLRVTDPLRVPLHGTLHP